MLVTFSGQMLDKFLEHIHGCGPASGILHEADRPCLTELISQSPEEEPGTLVYAH